MVKEKIKGARFMAILILLLLFYFIREQFEYSVVKKITYFFLPIFSLIQVLIVFDSAVKSWFILVLAIIVGALVGYYQAKHSQIKQQLTPIYYFYEQKKERKIYKKVVLVKGGKHYLFGWFAIFFVQVFIQIFILTQREDLTHHLYEELLNDLFSIYRFQGLEEKSDSWYAWALYGASSLFYLFFLMKKYPKVEEILFHTDKEELVEEEEAV